NHLARAGPAGDGAGERDGESGAEGGTWERLPGQALLTLRPGDRFRDVPPGAGGWGPPRSRDPERVLEDVRQEKVTPVQARAAYGVALRRGGGGAREGEMDGTA